MIPHILLRRKATRFATVWMVFLLPVCACLGDNQIESVEAAPNPDLVVPAALNGDLKAVEEALKMGYDANTKDATGRTAILYAAYNGHTDVVARLIGAGADVNFQDPGGSTALMFASSGPFAGTVTLLLENGAKINMVDNNEHFTALMWAAAEGQAEIVKLLLEKGADTTLTDIDGDNAESFAAQKGHVKVVELLKAAHPPATGAEKD